MRSKEADGGGRSIPLLENTSCLPTGPQTFPAAYRDLPSLTTQRANYARPFLGKGQRESHSRSPLARRRGGRAARAAEGARDPAQVRWTAPERGGRTPRPGQRRRYRRGTSPPPPPSGRQTTCPHPIPWHRHRRRCCGTAAAPTARLRVGK